MLIQKCLNHKRQETIQLALINLVSQKRIHNNDQTYTIGSFIFTLIIKQSQSINENINQLQYYIYQMIRILGVLLAILSLAFSAPAQDKMKVIPGYPKDYNTSIYTGYLDLKSPDRAAHYVFVQSINGPNNKDPVTLWLNGGPGCSSLMGFLQQIGPYYLQDGVNYKDGDNLTFNPHSWHRVSNLLFLQSPAGVGFSYNTNASLVYNDAITANDNLNALLDFYNKFKEYRSNNFWIAGESYAGKYIPDLAVLIDLQNAYQLTDFQIKLKGIMVGNGIMDFAHIQTSQVQYLKSRKFSNPQHDSYWDNACQVDPDSAGCRFFFVNFREDIDELNAYNIYSYCYYNDSFGEPQKRPHLTQQTILKKFINQYSNSSSKVKFNGAPCSYFDGMYNYFNINSNYYRAKWATQKWNGPCAENITYYPDPAGSMQSYRHLLGRIKQKNYQILLYNGNWDAVVPFTDTVKNIKKLNLVQSYLYTPWFTDDQHSGFIQIYSGVTFAIVKGASHMVPQSKRPESFNLFNMTISGNTGTLAKQAQQSKI